MTWFEGARLPAWLDSRDLRTWGGGLLLFLVIMIGARVVSRWTSRVSRRAGVEPAISLLITRAIGFAGLGIGTGAFLTSVQGNPGWLISSIGALAFVMGLGLQDLLKNILAGIYLLIERPFRLDDVIEVDGHAGRVLLIRSRVTVLEGEDGTTVIVPNADVLSKTVVRQAAPV